MLFSPPLLCPSLPSEDFFLGLLVPPSTLVFSLFRGHRLLPAQAAVLEAVLVTGVQSVGEQEFSSVMFTAISPVNVTLGARTVHPGHVAD